MENDPNQFPDDIEQCHAVIAEMAERLQQLQHIVAHLLRERYGQKAEKIDENQLVLFAGEILSKHSEVTTLPPEAPEPKRKVTPHGRQRLPEHLERKRVVYDLPESERYCPECHAALKCIGEEVSERLEYIPASLHVLQEVCPKYACEKGCTVVTAQKPMQPIEKGLPGPGLLAHIVVSKYCDHCAPRTRHRKGGGGFIGVCGAAQEMREGPSEPACRSRLQATSSCVGQEPRW